jgi:hypothetical protein
VRELRVPRAGQGVEPAAELVSAGPLAIGANEVPTVRRSLVPERAARAGRGVEPATELLSTGPLAIGANEAPTVRRSLVPELRAARAGRGVEPATELLSAGPLAIGANEAPTVRASVVPELPSRAPAWAPMVLPTSFGEMLRFAGESRPRTPLAPLAPVAPNPAVTVGPRPAIPPVAAIAGAELDRLAEKVSRVIARRVAVERERRGR